MKKKVCSQFFYNFREQIFDTNGHSACCQDHIRLCRTSPNCRNNRFCIIPDKTPFCDITPQLHESSRQIGQIGIIDFPGKQRLTRHHQFFTCCNDRYPYFSPD